MLRLTPGEVAVSLYHWLLTWALRLFVHEDPGGLLWKSVTILVVLVALTCFTPFSLMASVYSLWYTPSDDCIVGQRRAVVKLLRVVRFLWSHGWMLFRALMKSKTWPWHFFWAAGGAGGACVGIGLHEGRGEPTAGWARWHVQCLALVVLAETCWVEHKRLFLHYETMGLRTEGDISSHRKHKSSLKR